MLALALGLGIQTASGEEGVILEDKRLYDDHPLYIDLDLNPAESTDDNNFVVMQEGSVILYADSGMRIVAAEDKTSYTLYNPTSEALGIAPGTPVAFIDSTKQEAFFFVPIQVTVQSDRIVFACSPEKVESDYLFSKIGISVDKTFPFEYENFNFTNPAGTLTFKTNLNGDFHIKLSYNGISIAVETWVSYNLQDAVIDISDNFAQEIPIIKLPIAGVPGIGLEVGVGLGLFTEGDTKVSFDLTGGKAGFTAKGGIFQSPSFSSLSEKPRLNVEEITAEGDFEVDITFGPSIDLLSVAGLGCDIAEGISVSAELTGDEGGRDPNPLLEVKPTNPNVWHVCKELSCLQGEIDMLGKLEAWFQLAGHVWSVDYELFRVKISDFHYSFTFKEFKMELCRHYLYQVAVRVLEQGSKNPMEGVTVTYTEVPPYSDRRGKAYIEGVTDKDGYVHLYMPAADDPEKDNVQITATSWQDDPDGPGKVKKTVEYLVKETGQEQQTEIELPLYHYMELVYFEENAGNDTVENMPQPFWVEENHTGTIPNEVPRRKGCVFVGWSKDSAATTADYLPGSDIEVGTANIPLYAIWTQDQPYDDFRTITYVAGGDNVVLADNPQIYRWDQEGVSLISPWRKDHIFTGWTCEQIGLDKPTPQVTVQCTDQDGRTDFVNRTYVAHWEHVTYNVIWRNWDGSWLDVSRDLYNVEPTYEGPNPPVRPSDDSYFYVFAGWTPEIKVVTEDTEYTAVYNAYDLLKLVSSPASQTLPDGEEAVFTVVTSGGVAPLAYQWYVIPAGQGAGEQAPAATAIPGATTDTLCVTSSEEVSGNRYYCVVQDQVGQKIVSAEALLTLELPLPPATGDGFPLWPALALAVLSGTSLLIIIIKKRHNM